MPVQIERAVRHQLRPSEAGELSLHASIVHLAGVVADHEESRPNVSPESILFDPFAVTTTKFARANLPALLTEAQAQLQDTLALIDPHAMAA